MTPAIRGSTFPPFSLEVGSTHPSHARNLERLSVVETAWTEYTTDPREGLLSAFKILACRCVPWRPVSWVSSLVKPVLYQPGEASSFSLPCSPSTRPILHSQRRVLKFTNQQKLLEVGKEVTFIYPKVIWEVMILNFFRGGGRGIM